jgi:hypothetical protein
MRTSKRATPTGIRLTVVTWRYAPDCGLCGAPLAGREDDDYEENYAWHLDCARVLGELLCKRSPGSSNLQTMRTAWRLLPRVLVWHARSHLAEDSS